jgi:hypothetical protein
VAEREGFVPAISPSGISKLVINIAHLPPEAPELPHLALEQPQWQPNQLYCLSKAGIKARFDRVQVFDFSFWHEAVAHRSSALAFCATSSAGTAVARPESTAAARRDDSSAQRCSNFESETSSKLNRSRYAREARFSLGRENASASISLMSMMQPYRDFRIATPNARRPGNQFSRSRSSGGRIRQYRNAHSGPWIQKGSQVVSECIGLATSKPTLAAACEQSDGVVHVRSLWMTLAMA